MFLEDALALRLKLTSIILDGLISCNNPDKYIDDHMAMIDECLDINGQVLRDTQHKWRYDRGEEPNEIF